MWYAHGACTCDNALKPPGVVVPEICELLNLVDENRTWVFCKSRLHSLLLNHLSSVHGKFLNAYFFL